MRSNFRTRSQSPPALARSVDAVCAIAGANPLADSRPHGVAPDAATPVDYSAFRQHYLAMQRTMQTATGKLRGQLRDRLAAASADMARLAEVDAMMEGVLSPREHKLLAAVPALLGEHFERLQQAAAENTTTAKAAPTKKGMRQPQAARSDSLRVFCSRISRSRARSWPEISVTYWKLDQKPRCSAVAISAR